jgi:hypothetical protein
VDASELDARIDAMATDIVAAGVASSDDWPRVEARIEVDEAALRATLARLATQPDAGAPEASTLAASAVAQAAPPVRATQAAPAATGVTQMQPTAAAAVEPSVPTSPEAAPAPAASPAAATITSAPPAATAPPGAAPPTASGPQPPPPGVIVVPVLGAYVPILVDTVGSADAGATTD